MVLFNGIEILLLININFEFVKMKIFNGMKILYFKFFFLFK